MTLRQLGAILALLPASICLQAAELDDQAVWMQVDQQTGLIAEFPAVGRAEVIQDMGMLRSDLSEQRDELAHEADKKKFSVQDGVITAVMPGGLLYAAVRKQQHMQALTELHAVESQLDQLTSDSIEFTSAMYRVAGVRTEPGKVMVAALF